jgi:hypothetical protein
LGGLKSRYNRKSPADRQDGGGWRERGRMKVVLVTIATVGNFRVIVAISSLLLYIRYQIAYQYAGPKEAKVEDLAWTGLIFLAIYMACQIGRIGP